MEQEKKKLKLILRCKNSLIQSSLGVGFLFVLDWARQALGQAIVVQNLILLI